MDPMARTYGRIDYSEFDVFHDDMTSAEILEADARLTARWCPSNDNWNADGVDPTNWGVIRDHWSGDLREWCGQVDEFHPVRLGLFQTVRRDLHFALGALT